MIEFLYSLGDTRLVLLFVSVAIVTVVLIPRAVRRLLRLKPDTDAHDWAVRAMGTLISTSIFVLGFSLVQTNAAFNRVEAQVAGEASSINQLDRLMLRFGDGKLEDARGKLLAYARSIVTDEWKMLPQGRGSDDTRAAFAPLARAVFATEPAPGRQATIYGEMVRKLDDVAEMRETRIDNANVALPTVFWRVTVALYLVLAVMVCLIEQSIARTLALSAQVAAISSLLGMVFINDRPFLGGTSVAPTAIEKTIAVISARKP